MQELYTTFWEVMLGRGSDAGWLLIYAGLFAAALLIPGRMAWAQEEAPADTAQQEPVRLQADALSGATEQGEALRRLIGDVRLRQGDTRLWANRATQYLARKEILFRGDVLIVERGDSLSADSVLYDTRSKIGQASGNVRLTDGEVVVHAPAGRYFTDQQKAQFNEGLRMVDSTTVLTSQAGTYFSDARRAELYGNVHLNHPDAHLTADSLTYYRERDVSRARGHVTIERWDQEAADTTESASRTFILGGRAYNDEQMGYSRVEEQPILMHLRQDAGEVDTLLIRAKRLEAVRTDSLRRLTAVDSVRIWQHDFAAVSDSAVYDQYIAGEDSTREETRLFQSPVAWFQETQVSGDSLHTQGRSGSVDSLFVYQSAFAAQQDTLGRIQQLGGRRLLGLFHEEALRRLEVGPNAESVYYLTNEQGKPAGAVRVSGDSIAFSFREGTLRKIRVLSGVQGTHYPQGQIPSSLKLPNYRWLPDVRPSKEDLLKSRPPFRPLPGPDEAPEQLPAPRREPLPPPTAENAEATGR